MVTINGISSNSVSCSVSNGRWFKVDVLAIWQQILALWKKKTLIFAKNKPSVKGGI